MTVILRATMLGAPLYYRGSAHAHEWSPDQTQAATFGSESAARADLGSSPPVYSHLIVRARAVTP